MAFRNCAQPWMAEPKRHMDVPKERVSESHLPPARIPEQDKNEHRQSGGVDRFKTFYQIVYGFHPLQERLKLTQA